MSIIHIFLEITVIILFMLIKKTNKRENAILWVALSIVLLMCFNIFVTLIYYIIKIKCSLTNLSLSLILTIIGMSIYLYRTRKIQKYYLKKQDIIMNLILVLLTIVIAYMQFGFPFNINYYITDAAVHYGAAVDFYNASELLNMNNSNDIFNLQLYEAFMTGSYVNLGILFKGLSIFLTNTEGFVSVSIIFELFVLYLSGVLMYGLLSKKIHQMNQYIIVFGFTIFYVLGYQLNSEISGFSYLSLGMDIIISIIILMEYFLKNKINYNIVLISIFLLNLGLFFSYYFFVPVVYGAIFIVILVERKKYNPKMLTAEKFLAIFYILILPFLFGMYYFYFKELIKGNTVIGGIGGINNDGAIYFNRILNFVLFIPFCLYYIYSQKKDIEMTF